MMDQLIQEINTPSVWIEQYNRVYRWYRRFGEINEGVELKQQRAAYFDDVYAFFVNCYHLKDWIEKDETSGITRSELDRFVSTNEYLKLCADICNSSKHLQLRTQGRSGKNPHIDEAPHVISIDLKLGTTKIQQRFIFALDDSSIDGYLLATKCLLAWDEFILSRVKLRTIQLINGFDGQSVPGFYFGVSKNVNLPKFADGETVCNDVEGHGSIIQATTKSDMWLINLKMRSYEDKEDPGALLRYYRNLRIEYPDANFWLIVVIMPMSDTIRNRLARYKVFVTSSLGIQKLSLFLEQC